MNRVEASLELPLCLRGCCCRRLPDWREGRSPATRRPSHSVNLSLGRIGPELLVVTQSKRRRRGGEALSYERPGTVQPNTTPGLMVHPASRGFTCPPWPEAPPAFRVWTEGVWHLSGDHISAAKSPSRERDTLCRDLSFRRGQGSPGEKSVCSAPCRAVLADRCSDSGRPASLRASLAGEAGGQPSGRLASLEGSSGARQRARLTVPRPTVFPGDRL
ncbi:hypothetical protein HPB47_000944 [Ixodes persulcatus]|uniref:Uncharacterized protein n=1 Tax=Ixodes persulcatus TaxID=34615 RepID=A0AC60PQF0_IXOPE|nr:hypothetical protein HPB47_000944 [Ixodes persulcatus]